MVRKLLITVVIIVFLFSSNSAYAQTATVTPHVTEGMRSSQNINLRKNEKIDTFKKRVSEIKDQKKKEIVERIVTKINESNISLTGKMLAGIDRMTTIITETTTKSAALKTEGKDTSALDISIQQSSTAIKSAKDAATTQSQKEYSANITSDSTLKTDIGKMVSTFRTDIKATHSLVSQARTSVLKTNMELKKLTSEREIPTSVEEN